MYRNRNNSAAAATSSDDEDDHRHEIDSSSVCRWSKLNRTYECTRCGYVSQRKSNVGRHYKRIHCELKKHKTCVCDQVFKTKGEFYEHCDRLHPHLRHSWYITTEKYKIGKFKPELPLRTDLVGEPSSNKAVKTNEKKVIRYSPRLLSLYGKPLCNDQDVDENDVSDDCKRKKPLNGINSKNNRVEEDSTDDEVKDESDDSSEKSVENGSLGRPLVEDVNPESVVEDENKENITARVECDVNTIQEDTISSTDSTMDNSHVPKSVSPSAIHLPLKKRFGNFTKRKGLSDITNVVVNNSRSNDQSLTIKRLKFNSVHNNINQVQADNHDSAIVNDAPRAFISQIDFDELDAILNLKYLQNSVH